MKAKTIAHESGLVLDNGYSFLYDSLMARFRKLADSLFKQVGNDSNDLNALNAEREGLRCAAMRFDELAEIARPKEERLAIAAALLLNTPQRDRIRRNALGVIADGFDIDDAISTPVAPEQLEISYFPLWKIIREVVRHTSEIQVVRLERALKEFGVKVRRQSIESALATHKKDFKITWRGREKFVSLK